MIYIIDRFEGIYALCEDHEGNLVQIEADNLPKDAGEGDVIELINGAFKVCHEKTKNRKQKIEELAKELWID